MDLFKQKVKIEEINENNFYKVIKIKQNKNKNYVASAVYSLAEAYLYREAGDVFPFAILFNEEVVGYLMIEKNFEYKQYILWRILIAEEFQGKGIGSACVDKVIEWAKEERKFDEVIADYVIGNDIMASLLEKKGFQRTRFKEDVSEYEMIYKLDR